MLNEGARTKRLSIVDACRSMNALGMARQYINCLQSREPPPLLASCGDRERHQSLGGTATITKPDIAVARTVAHMGGCNPSAFALKSDMKWRKRWLKV
jgi:hypothetical protein